MKVNAHLAKKKSKYEHNHVNIIMYYVLRFDNIAVYFWKFENVQFSRIADTIH